MAVTFQSKTEATVGSSPLTLTHPSGLSDGDVLVLMASGPTISLPTLAAADEARGWVYYGNAISNMNMLVAYKVWRTGDAAPALTNCNSGVYAMYRYSGVYTMRLRYADPTATSSQDSPYVSGENGEEIIWYGVARRGSTPAPTVAFSRGTVETTNLTNGFYVMSAYREALSGGVNMVQATMTTTNTPSQTVAGAVILSDEPGWVYKGRDSAASDTTGAA